MKVDAQYSTEGAKESQRRQQPGRIDTVAPAYPCPRGRRSVQGGRMEQLAQSGAGSQPTVCRPLLPLRTHHAIDKGVLKLSPLSLKKQIRVRQHDGHIEELEGQAEGKREKDALTVKIAPQTVGLSLRTRPDLLRTLPFLLRTRPDLLRTLPFLLRTRLVCTLYCGHAT
jgi:hypothetical protein